MERNAAVLGHRDDYNYNPCCSWLFGRTEKYIERLLLRPWGGLSIVGQRMALDTILAVVSITLGRGPAYLESELRGLKTTECWNKRCSHRGRKEQATVSMEAHYALHYEECSPWYWLLHTHEERSFGYYVGRGELRD